MIICVMRGPLTSSSTSSAPMTSAGFLVRANAATGDNQDSSSHQKAVLKTKSVFGDLLMAIATGTAGQEPCCSVQCRAVMTVISACQAACGTLGLTRLLCRVLPRAVWAVGLISTAAAAALAAAAVAAAESYHMASGWEGVSAECWGVQKPTLTGYMDS